MKVLFVEFHAHHDECLYSQIAFIKQQPGNEVALVCNKKLLPRISYMDMIDRSFAVRNRPWSIDLFRVALFIRKFDPDVVVINTLHHELVPKLMKFSFKDSIQFVLLAHFTPEALAPELPVRTDKFLVLNDCLLPSIRKYSEKPACSFYPIFFPEQHRVELEKPEDEIWIAVPGKMERHRQYELLIEALAHKQLKPNIRLVFLGRAKKKDHYAQSVIERCRALIGDNGFLYWTDYVPNELMAAYLEKSDFIMPLAGSEFYQERISGAFNLAFAYKKPLLLDEFFSHIEDFQGSALFFRKDSLVDILNSLEADSKTNLYTDMKWAFDFQAEQYRDFLRK